MRFLPVFLVPFLVPLGSPNDKVEVEEAPTSDEDDKEEVDYNKRSNISNAWNGFYFTSVLPVSSNLNLWELKEVKEGKKTYNKEVT